MFQSEFFEHTQKHFGLVNINMDSLFIQYIHSLPIKSLPKLNISPSYQIIFTHCDQSLLIRLKRLDMCTQPDLTPGISFLSDYNHNHSPEDLKAAIYLLWYAHLN